ncbi:MAG: hypothetical protein ACI8RD_012549 [Bacillariaceae sp.]|jgi:hypothetical protein
MSSKKIGSPLSSIFQQWKTQQQQKQQQLQQEKEHPSSSPSFSASSYRILLQTSYSLQTRISATEPVENPHLYRRAGVATPQDRATRDIYGGGETTGWLLRLVELAVKQQQQQQQQQQHDVSNDAAANNTTTNSSIASVVFITTKRRPQNYSVIEELPDELRTKVKVIDLVSNDPFGWDNSDSNDGTDVESVTTTNMNSLPQIYKRLQEEFRKKDAGPIILIWQSLTPLILVHGFPKILRLLCALPTCLQVWPINVQLLTPKQHAQLEDASNALLCMQGGEMTMIRQGVRERGNILREKLPFRLTPIFKDGQQRYRVVEGAENKEDTSWYDVDHNDDGVNNNNNDDTNNNNKDVVYASNTKAMGGSKSRGVQLRIEEEDEEDEGGNSGGGRNERIVAKVSSSENDEVAAPNRPRIYMQDNDPEFDDFDEEDPDDDLEI